MRVNVYAEEMTDRIEIIAKEVDGQQFTGCRFYLELPVTVPTHDGAIAVHRGPFMHKPGDDDSAAVTFWGKRDLRAVLRAALVKLDEHYADGDARRAAASGETDPAIARVAHEVNRAYCQALGDNSQVAWEEAPQWQRDSALLGVRLHRTNPDAGPQASHESWMAQKVAEGWVYGPTKDPEAKTHHCIVPFDQLPREQQAKDYLFRGVVLALAAEHN